MSAQLDILALEPFYGGVRRHMLETLIRHSRHRWTLLKLPPRRIERRLVAASAWFAEQMTRHWSGRMDLIFASDAMNLSDLFRLIPSRLRRPSVVYFHANQLPDPTRRSESPLDLVNLNSASAASEIWFNSLFHLRTFFARASAMVARHAELSSHDPMPQLAGKSQIMYPPIDLARVHEVITQSSVQRKKRMIFVDTRDADLSLLNAALSTLQRRGQEFELATVGPLEGLSEAFARRTISEIDDTAQLGALCESGVYLSTRLDAPFDHHAVRALVAGCWAIVPDTGVYPEMIPAELRDYSLYNGTHDLLVSRLLDYWHIGPPDVGVESLIASLKKYDALAACRAMDQRMEELVVTQSVRTGGASSASGKR